MLNEKTIRLNIAFRVSGEAAKEAMKLSREIAKSENVYFVLDDVGYFPHITNYGGEFPEKNLDKISKTVSKLVANFSAIEMKFTQTIADCGWVGVYFEYSEELKKIHSAFVEKLNPLRGEIIKEKFIIPDNFTSDEEKDNFLKFGHPWILNLYKPHLTITKLLDHNKAEEIARDLNWSIGSFKVDSIGIFISGEQGTCRKLLGEYRLI